MSLLQRIGRALRGDRGKPVTSQVRRYKAARPDRLVSGFRVSLGTESPHEQLRRDLRGLVDHSRELAQNNDYFLAFLNRCQNNIVGPRGIRLQMAVRQQASDLAETGTLDTGANAAIENAWARWGQRGVCTVCGRYSLLDLQHIAASTVPRDGNVLARMYRGRQFGPFAFQLQLLSIDFLDIELCRSTTGGGYIDGGIEFDSFDRPLAYHLFTVHPGANHNRRSRKRDRIRVPAADVVHLFRPTDVGQLVGAPWAHTALRRLNMLAGFEEASLTNARAGASKMGFFTREIDDTYDKPGDGDQDSPELEDFDPGTVETLPVGYKFEGFDPGYPNGEIEPFLKVILRGAAAGLGVAYSSLANDLEKANFSSLRTGLGDERDHWRALQSWMAGHFLGPVFSDWLPMAIASGELRLPAKRIDKFDAARWRPRGWQAIQPREESVANETNLRNGLRAPQDIVGERGDDLADVYERIAEARELAAQYGLDFTPGPAVPEPPTTGQSPDDQQ